MLAETVAPAGLRLGGQAWRLPPGARVLPEPPLRRPLPGGMFAMLDGAAVPALDPDGVADQPGAAWLALAGAEGAPVLLVTEVLTAVPAGTPALPPALLRPAAPKPVVLPMVPPVGAARAEPAARADARRSFLAGQLRLRLGEATLAIPAGLVLRVAPHAETVPAPGAPASVAGYALVDEVPTLVLHPPWPEPGPAGAAPTLLVVLHHAGRRFALPCARVTFESGPPIGGPGPPPNGAVPGWLDAADTRAALAWASVAAEPVRPPRAPRHDFLLCRAAGQDFALPAAEVTAVVAPEATAPAAAGSAVRGVLAHRGTVMPVLDAGTRLGGPAALGAGPVPLLRLDTDPPVAVAVSAVLRLVRVGEGALSAVGGVPHAAGGLVSAVARLDGAAVPVLRAAALAGAP